MRERTILNWDINNYFNSLSDICTAFFNRSINLSVLNTKYQVNKFNKFFSTQFSKFQIYIPIRK